MAARMLDALAKNWWILLLRGILAVLFGLMALVLPGETLIVLVLLFGAYACIDGITALWTGASARIWGLVLLGLLGLGAGIYTFVYPGVTAIALLYLIAVWAIIRGIFEVVAAIQLREVITGEWALIGSGIISIILGAVLCAKPAAGALAMVWVIGAGALIFGILIIMLAFRVRGMGSEAGNR